MGGCTEIYPDFYRERDRLPGCSPLFLSFNTSFNKSEKFNRCLEITQFKSPRTEKANNPAKIIFENNTNTTPVISPII